MTKAETSTAHDGLPKAVVRFVVLMVTVAVAVTVAWVAAPTAGSNPPYLIALFLMLGTGAMLLPVRILHRGGVAGFNLNLAVALGMGWTIDDGSAVLIVGLGAMLGSLMLRAGAAKVLFNGSLQVLSASAAYVTAIGVLESGSVAGDILTPRGALALVAAAMVGEATNILLLGMLFRGLRDEPLRVVLRGMMQVTAPASLAANLLTASLLIVLAERSPVALLLSTPLFVALVIGSRDTISVSESGQQAAELHDLSHALLTSATSDGGFDEVEQRLRALFRSEHAIVDLGGESPRDHGYGDIVARVRDTGDRVLDPEGDGVLATPVVLEGQIVGVLLVAGRRGVESWDQADLALLGTVAGEVGALLRTRRLFAEVERERASLAVESQRLSDILYGASDGIVMLDEIGRIEACNPAMAALVGLLPEDALGRRWDDVLRLEHADGTPVHAASREPFARALAGEGRIVEQVRLVQADGGWRWLRCSVAPVASNRGVAGVVLVAIDRTAEREVEELRGDFLATVSHELRTPLTPLRGFLSVLDQHGAGLSEDRFDTIIGSMTNQLGRLEALIGDLLLVGEIESGVPQVRVEEVDVADAVDEVVALELAAGAERSRIEVEVDDVSASADPAAFRRIVRSLVSNALKHTEGDVRVFGHVDGDDAVVVVEDDGPGIAPHERETVFEPFRRLGSHLHRTQGPGLGLAIARSLAEACGGTLDVVPAPGGGASFRLRLPTARRARRPRRGAAPTGRRDRGSR